VTAAIGPMMLEGGGRWPGGRSSSQFLPAFRGRPQQVASFQRSQAHPGASRRIPARAATLINRLAAGFSGQRQPS